MSEFAMRYVFAIEQPKFNVYHKYFVRLNKILAKNKF